MEKSDLAFDDIANEIDILKALDHPSILHLHAHYVSEHGDKVYLVTELLEGGELLEALLDRGNYTEADAAAIMRPVLEGLAYMHSRGVTHRDLKLENLLLADATDLSSVRIADFGLAKAAFSSGNGDRPGVGAICGTPSYLAPEIIAGQRYTPAVDCWAAGVCVYILLSGVVPFNWTDRPGADLRELFDRISAGSFSVDGPEWEGVSDGAKNLVHGLMCVDVSSRLTAEAALAHPWLSSPAPGTAPTPLAHLPAAQAKLRAFAAATRLPVRRFRAGEYLVREGERASEVFLIRTGECELLRESSGGGAPVRLALAGEGEFVGRPVALDGQGNAVDLDVLLEDDAPADGAGAASTDEGKLLGDKFSTLAMGPRRGTRCVAALCPMRACDCCHPARCLTLTRSVHFWLCSIRAVTDCEVVVMGRGHVQGVLAKDPAVRTEVLTVQERRRRELESGTAASLEGQPHAGALIIFCGLDHMVLDASRGLGAWWTSLWLGLPWMQKR